MTMHKVGMRYGTLLILLLMVVGFLGTIVVAEGQRTPDWKVAFARAVPGTSIVVTTRATMPSAFDETMPTRLIERGELLALPGSPVELHCVLGQRGNDEQLYFVAFYDDTLWHADWTIWEHDQRVADAAVQQALATIGCLLPLDSNR
jgi:hypothetical protein